MPVELLSESERVKLSRFPEEILPEDLRRHFTPQEGKWAYGLSWALSPGPLHLNLIRHSWRIHLIAVLFQRRALGDAETVDGVIRASNAKLSASQTPQRSAQYLRPVSQAARA